VELGNTLEWEALVNLLDTPRKMLPRGCGRAWL
jgi:hypothetical protein